MAAIQLNFTLRTSGNVKTVHLLGSWDNYTGQLPLSKDPSKSGAWKSTFRFPSTTLKQGQRYWYYYILDGYHVSHDPARESVVEPTTRRSLNVLDIPSSTVPAAAVTRSSATTTAAALRQSQRLSLQVPQGRPLPATQIVSPKPYKPGQVRQICAEQFAAQTMEQLARNFAAQRLSVASVGSDEEEDDEDDDSDADSDVPSLTSSRSSRASSPTSSSVSSDASRCSCERYGITRAGARVRLDCGGKKCGYEDESEEEEDESCGEEEEDQKVLQYRRAVALTRQQMAVRRQGMVIR